MWIKVLYLQCNEKILIYLTITWAVFFPNSFSAHDHDIEPQQGFNIAQQYDNFARYLSSGENIFWEVYFEDLSDDNSDNSERKKVSLGTITPFDNSFLHVFRTTIP